ncbi:receptor-like protein 6 [Salvia miltiorrhiza]|uniref:receptor-like protein 6 n=1 Tax=Salvia miltiorrhiza TaxID=226208 RepID=UPI0025ABD290|nr:receptor-like protein 6 [Salvia miltiorrhiza]
MLPKLFFIISTLISSFIFSHSYSQCLHHQKTLLLQLKDELSFDSSVSTKLVRWNESDECCKWHGVDCDAAGYVVSLQLDRESISGGITDSSSLFRLLHLQKLNLAYNSFNNTPIPKGIHNLTYLTHLNLSDAGFGGQVPAEISSLRRLVCLDISYDDRISVKLETLVQNLTGLRELYLDHDVNVTSNDLSTELPDLFTNFPSLTTLSLCGCGLKGSIPSTFANLTNLIRLDLSSNSFLGSLSSTLFEGLSNLVYLDLRSNSFSGNIPHSLFDLPSLLQLDLRNNQFNGTFHLDNFRSLANLTLLGLSHNRLLVDVGNLNSTSYGSLQLKVLRLASCKLSHFPNFTKHLDMEEVDLSNNQIGGEIPSWIWGTQLWYLNLSFNLLTDLQKPYHIPASLLYLYLDSNQLKGEFHLPIPPVSHLMYLSAANNSLSGFISTSLCSSTRLISLDLSGNKLSGIPPFENISSINLGQNSIGGHIPDNFSQDCKLQYLDLNNNSLQGRIPKSLQNCRCLELLNVGNNNINDTFPCMLSSTLRGLVLSSNQFHGEVTCHTTWPRLQIVDISSNNFSGSLESINFSTWSSMLLKDINGYYPLSISLTIKGHFETYDLTSLHQLNFSHNALDGSIPKSFGQLRSLESLDLSGNRLTGLIPVELAGLTFLSFLNLSYNKLVGKIPNGRQFQTFSADSFKENPGLCGFNVNISCSGSDGSDHLWPQEYENGEDQKSEIEWEYVSAALGYVVGLGIIVWLLLFCRSFKERYFEKIEEKILLLQLKDELSFNSSLSTKLVRWNERGECCKWHGVECDVAGYVVSLQLDNESISGGIADSSSLFRLVHMQKLNLAYNDFNNTPIPKGIHNLTYLTHLNLSHAEFGGQVPAEISSLRRLVSLDISYDYRISVKLEMLVQNLTGLRELYLDYVNVNSSHERRKWSHIISSYLPNLTALSLYDCGLSGPLAKSFWQLHSLSILRLDYNHLGPELPDLFANFPSLTTLSLYNCDLNGSIPPTFANLTNLIHLDLSYNFFTGSLSCTLFEGLSNLVYLNFGYNSFSGNIPHSLFANLTKLIRVDLSSNSFIGSLSSTLFEGLSNLVYLDLSYNSFSGNIPHSLFALPSFSVLDLSNNQFNGTFQLDNFPSLANLIFLDLSENRLSVDVGNVNSTSYGNLQLKTLELASCNLSHFPSFIKHLDMIYVDLSDNRIGGEIPSWIWGTQLVRLNLSYNLLTDLQNPYHIPASLEELYLDSNKLKGELHLPIPPASLLGILLVANNSLSGSIPTSLCSATNLDILDLSGNKLSGSIPPCLLENIAELDLSQNNISGSIPDNFPMDCSLQYLDLNNNTLEGKIPKSLERCELLVFMNVGNNNITDSFPCMLSSSRGLHLLVLHSNRFYGEVRCHDMSWPYLQILDISSNQFSGNLESINFSGWKTMMLQSDDQLRSGNSVYYYSQLWKSLSITLIVKGINSEFHTIWSEFGTIDFSCNNFGGEIPNAIGDLTSLHQLNLSHNALNGSIPNSFGQLRNLESLDLSGNRLTGLIPMELAGLSFLSVLNLSYNKLVGEIPNGRQFQTFSADSFKGNPGLCGFNLNISCIEHLWPQEDENGEEKSEIEWEYVSAAAGYVVGLGIIVWLLLFCRSCRERYFEKIEDVVDNIFYERARKRRHERRSKRVEMRKEIRRQQQRS